MILSFCISRPTSQNTSLNMKYSPCQVADQFSAVFLKHKELRRPLLKQSLRKVPLPGRLMHFELG